MKYDLSNAFEAKKAQNYLDGLIKSEDKVEITKKRAIRSIPQNSYLHVCITLYAIHFGYTIEESKTHLKRNCAFMIYEKEGEKFLKRTRDLDTKELTDFIEWIRAYSAVHGCYVPTSEEYITNKFNIDKEIELQKTYL